MLHLYRTLPEDKKELLLEQGKLLVTFEFERRCKIIKIDFTKKK